MFTLEIGLNTILILMNKISLELFLFVRFLLIVKFNAGFNLTKSDSDTDSRGCKTEAKWHFNSDPNPNKSFGSTTPPLILSKSFPKGEITQ